MRKKFLSFFAFSILFAVVVVPVFADDSMMMSSSSAGVHPVMQRLDGAQQTVRETVRDVKTAVQSQKQQLKAALQKIKDQHKQQVVNNIDTRIGDLNKKYTDQWTTALINLQSRLDRLKTKAGTSTTSATLSSDIAGAQSALTTAKNLVSAQATKTYTIQVVSDATLHTTVGQTVTQFKTDLLRVHMEVMNARMEVLNAAGDLGGMTPTIAPNAATGSAAQL